MKVLFVDDQIQRHDTFRRKVDLIHTIIPAFTYEQACNALREHRFDEAWLDHDLQDYMYFEDGRTREYTGADIARYIATELDKAKIPKKVVVHSFNAPGAANMAAILKEAGVPVELRPFRFS